MKTLNTMRDLLTYPIRLITLTFAIPMLLILTDFRDEKDRNYSLYLLKKLIKPY